MLKPFFFLVEFSQLFILYNRELKTMGSGFWEKKVVMVEWEMSLQGSCVWWTLGLLLGTLFVKVVRPLGSGVSLEGVGRWAWTLRHFKKEFYLLALKIYSYYFLTMCMHVSECGCVHVHWCVHRGQRHQMPLELGLQAVVSWPIWLLGTALWSLARAARALNPWASLQPGFEVLEHSLSTWLQVQQVQCNEYNDTNI